MLLSAVRRAHLGTRNIRELRSHHPAKPSGFNVRRVLGSDDLWITGYIITYPGRPSFTVSIMEVLEGKRRRQSYLFQGEWGRPNFIVGLCIYEDFC